LDDSATRGASMPSTETAGLVQVRSTMLPVPMSATPDSTPASPRKVASSTSGAPDVPCTRPGTATSPCSSCRPAKARHSAVSASPIGPPNTPECTGRSNIDTSMTTSTSPRRLVVRAGTSTAGLAASAITITSQASASRCSRRNAGQRGRAGLLLALDEQRDPDRRAAVERAQRGEVGHDARLVVGGAARVEATVALGGLERRRRPQLVAAGRLDVVVGVEQHGRRGGRRGPAGQDGGRAVVGRQYRDVGRAGPARQLGDGLGAAVGVVGVRGVGPDAGDADEAFEVGACPGQLLLDGGAQCGLGRAVGPGHGLVGHAGRLYAGRHRRRVHTTG
jgi:hypothetical protein